MAFTHGCIVGCSFPRQPESAGFNWSGPEFRFAGADNANRDPRSRVLEQTLVY